MIAMTTFAINSLIWLGLFAASVLLDWLAAKWTDTLSRVRRAHISAIHEAVGFAAGFTVFTWTQSVWTIIPCVLGSWVGSYVAGVDRDELDPALVEAVHDAVELVLDREYNRTEMPKRT